MARVVFIAKLGVKKLFASWVPRSIVGDVQVSVVLLCWAPVDGDTVAVRLNVTML